MISQALSWSPLRVAMLLLAVMLAFGTALGVAHAQGDPENVVIHDLATRDGVPNAAIDVVRLDAVIWSDACLGLAADGEACAEVLTPGWVVWLASGDTVTRYHTDVDGSVFRFAVGGLVLDGVRGAPLPAGATPREDRPTSNPDTPVLVLAPGVGTVADFLTALDAARLPSDLQEIAILRPEIGTPSAGQVQLAGATIEIYDLGSVAAGEVLVNALRDEATVLAGNVTYWVGGQIAVVLTNAPANPDVELVITSVVGSPALLTITGPPSILPGTDDAAADGAVPETLPNTGSGGVAETDAPSAIALGAGVGAALLAALVLTLGVRRRRLG